MTHYAYLTVLLASLLAMLVLDWRYCLAYFVNRRRTSITIITSATPFIVWDLLGIGLGIFFSGHSKYMSGIYLAPEFPLEELFFLVFLCYFTLILYRGIGRIWPRI